MQNQKSTPNPLLALRSEFKANVFAAMKPLEYQSYNLIFALRIMKQKMAHEYATIHSSSTNHYANLIILQCARKSLLCNKHLGFSVIFITKPTIKAELQQLHFRDKLCFYALGAVSWRLGMSIRKDARSLFTVFA
jgi:hypothetical protein